MKRIRLVRIGDADQRLLEDVRKEIARQLGMPCDLDKHSIDPAFALHTDRGQYHSTALVGAVHQLADGDIVVGVAGVDLYIPILTFVFGEAAVDGKAAVVSYHRLRQEFYGLPADARLLRERLVKEVLHETGHAVGLAHCEDYECVMAASHAIEWLDLKGEAFCDECWPRIA